MKNAAKCDTSCELQNPVSHQNFERNLHLPREVCLLECLFIPTCCCCTSLYCTSGRRPFVCLPSFFFEGREERERAKMKATNPLHGLEDQHTMISAPQGSWRLECASAKSVACVFSELFGQKERRQEALHVLSSFWWQASLWLFYFVKMEKKQAAVYSCDPTHTHPSKPNTTTCVPMNSCSSGRMRR